MINDEYRIFQRRRQAQRDKISRKRYENEENWAKKGPTHQKFVYVDPPLKSVHKNTTMRGITRETVSLIFLVIQAGQLHPLSHNL